MRGSDRLFDITQPLSMSLPSQGGIEQMREPDACFLQLLPDDRGVRRDIGRVDLHFAGWMIAGRTLSNAVLRSRLLRDGDRRGQIKDLVSISQRPAAVEDRAVPGHWEGDLLAGSKNSYIATLVERHTRYVMLAKVTNKDTHTVVSALIEQARRLPNELYKSLTWDRGKELSDHRRFTLATNIDVYFCDPQSPWQRGSNENTNGLLRQYFPKGTDPSVYSQAHLNKVARRNGAASVMRPSRATTPAQECGADRDQAAACAPAHRVSTPSGRSREVH